MKSSRVTIILIVLLAISAFAINNLYQENQRLERDLSYYESTYLFKGGWTSFNDYGSYSLASFDGGQNWYAVDRGEDRSLTIVGPAEEIYPGLVKQQTGLEELFKYVEENGPIGSSGSFTNEDLEALEAAGFTTEKK